MSGLAYLRTKVGGCDHQLMRRSFIILVAALAMTSSGCRRKDPAVCNVGPPEDSRYYQQWADDITAAHCKNMHIDNNAVERPAPVRRIGG